MVVFEFIEYGHIEKLSSPHSFCYSWHMFSLFKKKVVPSERTLKGRVEEFWTWYAEAAPRFYETIERMQCPSLAEEVSRKIDEILPGFSWVFGPGADNLGHSFTLTAEGNRHKQLLTAYWKTRAPKLAGWTFYDSRQPSRNIAGHQIEIGNELFNPIEFWVTPTVSDDAEKIELNVWHPKFTSLPEKARWTVLFLFLDELLGETGTQSWIGRIDMVDTRLADAMPITELPSFIRELEANTGWKKLPPGEEYSLYRVHEPHDRFPRGDIFVGVTSQMVLQAEYTEADGELKDPLAGTGADYIYASFPMDFLPQGHESETRGRMEDELDHALDQASSGRCLGGACGRRFAYLDAVIFDGATSLDIVRDTLRRLKLPREAVIRYFAIEKRDKSLRLG